MSLSNDDLTLYSLKKSFSASVDFRLRPKLSIFKGHFRLVCLPKLDTDRIMSILEAG